MDGNSSGVDEVLMDLVVMPAGTVDELAGLEDRYERKLMNVLESVAVKLEKLSADDRRAFAAHVESMSERAAVDPLVSAGPSQVPSRVSGRVWSDRERKVISAHCR